MMEPTYLAACRCRWEIREARRRAAEEAATWERLQPWAFIYMVTGSGGAEVPMYLAERRHAEVFCSDERTKGIGRGGPWAFMFTSAATYLLNPMGHTSIADLGKKARLDDGRFASLVAELKIVLYGRHEWGWILDPLIQQPRAEASVPALFDLDDSEDGAA